MQPYAETIEEAIERQSALTDSIFDQVIATGLLQSAAVEADEAEAAAAAKSARMASYDASIDDVLSFPDDDEMEDVINMEEQAQAELLEETLTMRVE